MHGASEVPAVLRRPTVPYPEECRFNTSVFCVLTAPFFLQSQVLAFRVYGFKKSMEEPLTPTEAPFYRKNQPSKGKQTLNTPDPGLRRSRARFDTCGCWEKLEACR